MNLSCECDWEYFIQMVNGDEVFHKCCPLCGAQEMNVFGYWLSLNPSVSPFAEYLNEK